MKVATSGLHEAQQAMMKTLAAVKPSGLLGRVVHTGLTMALHRSIARTHVETGALRLAQRGRMETDARGRVYIDPSALGVRRIGGKLRVTTTKRPAVYGAVEHSRGGSHAFYEQVERLDGSNIAWTMITTFMRGMP